MKLRKTSALVLAALVSLPLASATVLAETDDNDAVAQTETQALGYLGELSESIILSGRLEEFKSTSRYDDIYANGETLAKRIKFWHNVALDTVALDHTPGASASFEPGTPGFASPDQGGPTRTSRALAMVHIAMFDAVNAIQQQYHPYAGGDIVAAHGASADAAVVFAAARTLRRLYPAQRDRINAIFSAEKDRVKVFTTNAEFRAGRAVGVAAFKAVRDARRGDRSRQAEPNFGEGGKVANGGTTTFFGTGVNGGGANIGEWQPDPNVPEEAPDFELALGAFWGNVKPFFMSSGDQFRTPAPPLPDDPEFYEYAEAFEEVARIGGAEDNANTPSVGTDRTRFIGNYWGYDGVPLIGVPPRVYNQIASQLAFEKYSDDALAFARVLAMVNIAMADVGIAAWDSKYFYNYWRPVTGVQAEDNNPMTVNDPTWDPVGVSVVNTAEAIRPTPPFPAYPSGHAAFGATTFEILREAVGNVRFTFVSDEYDGVSVMPTESGPVTRPFVPRRFSSLDIAQESNGISRIYNGVHWDFDNTAGQAQGESIARFLMEDITAFQPK